MWTCQHYREEHRLAHLSVSFSGVHTQSSHFEPSFLVPVTVSSILQIQMMWVSDPPDSWVT